jgi:hypothetical protein
MAADHFLLAGLNHPGILLAATAGEAGKNSELRPREDARGKAWLMSES